MSTETTAKAQIKTTDVLAMLAGGQDRETIRLHYGLTKAQSKRLFAHPSLKGKKIKNSTKNDPFEIIDDAPTKTSSASTATEAPASSSNVAVETEPGF